MLTCSSRAASALEGVLASACKRVHDKPLRTHPRRPKTQLIAARALLALIISLLTVSRAFDSLFKVLFIFPSRYLFAIGLVPIFSFR
jgi:hypothetical protein